MMWTRESIARQINVSREQNNFGKASMRSRAVEAFLELGEFEGELPIVAGKHEVEHYKRDFGSAGLDFMWVNTGGRGFIRVRFGKRFGPVARAWFSLDPLERLAIYTSAALSLLWIVSGAVK